MTWTAPTKVPREDPPFVSAERAALQGWLDYHRATLLSKCAGLTGDQLAIRSAEPSSMSLLGLVRHMTDVERWWFRRFIDRTGPPPVYWTEGIADAEWDEADPAGAEACFAAYTAECAAADDAVRDLSLDEVITHPSSGRQIDMRWVYLHMIEEYARHNGHADLLRERIDGATGD
jgi:uncharacterized damage-inducible protein DinB